MSNRRRNARPPLREWQAGNAWTKERKQIDRMADLHLLMEKAHGYMAATPLPKRGWIYGLTEDEMLAKLAALGGGE